MEMRRRFGPLVGRTMLAVIFILSGYSKITGYSGTLDYMASHGLPFPELLLPFAILIELGGGLMLLVGWKARLAAALLFLFIIPTTLVFHAFWSVDPAQVQLQKIMFLKNLAIMGGMLYVMVYGPGPLSLDKK
jgi:putative oxidoreductase